jgi:hypothetical protein
VNRLDVSSAEPSADERMPLVPEAESSASAALDRRFHRGRRRAVRSAAEQAGPRDRDRQQQRHRDSQSCFFHIRSS